MAAEESPLPCLCLSQTPTGRILPEPICQTHLFFAFDALRLPLRFVLTLAFWKAGGAQFAVELDFNKAGRFQIINSVFTPTEAYYDSKNVHTNQ